MVKVSPNAGGVGHHMRDVVLLMDAVKQVCHWALGKDRHVFPTVGLVAQGDSGLGLVVVVSCRSEISFECLPEPQCCERNTPFSSHPGGGISPDMTGFKPSLPHPGDHTLSPLEKIHLLKRMWHLHRPGTKLSPSGPWHLPG